MASIKSRLVATTFAVALVAASIPSAQARDNWGAAAAGLVGGLVIGGALASSRPAYAYPPPAYYAPPPAYYAPAPTTYYSYAPAPTYYAPAPTYYSYAPSYYSGGYYVATPRGD